MKGHYLKVPYQQVLKKAVALLIIPFLFPVLAFAHQTNTYQINGSEYKIKVGSQTEPLIVDDRNAVTVEITKDGQPFAGAADTLQLEMSAGSVKKTFSLVPNEDTEGMYTADFIPTVPTTATYTLVGKLSDTPVTLAYTCSQAEDPEDTADVTTPTNISTGVTQTLKSGGFGCAIANADIGFPDPAISTVELNKSVTTVKDDLAKNAQSDSSTNTTATASLVVSIIALGLGVFAIVRKR